MNLAQAKALVRLLESADDEQASATIKRPGDINSPSYEVTIHGSGSKALGEWELRDDGEAVPLA